MYPAVPVLARAWGLDVREYDCDREQGFAQTAEQVLAAVDASTRAVFVNTPHNPTGSVMAAAEQRKLAEALAARGIPLIVDEVYHPLYFAGDVPSASALPNTIVLGDFAKALSIPGLRIGWLIDRDAQRREALLDLRSYFTISGSPLTEAIGAHALAHAPVILAAAARRGARAISRCSRGSWRNIERCSAGRRRPAAPRVSPGCAMAATRGRCARRWRRRACWRRRAIASTCRRTFAWGLARCAVAMRMRSRSFERVLAKL